MASRLYNIVVVGRSDLSTAILQSLAQARPSHTHVNDNPDDISRPDLCHHYASLYNLTILIRPHQTTPSIHNLKQQTSDYSFSSLTTAFQNYGVIISTVAAADVIFQKGLIDAAVAAHVLHFIPCELSYDTQNLHIRDSYPPCLESRGAGISEGQEWPI